MAFQLQSSAPRCYGASHFDQDMVDWGPQPDSLEGNSQSRGRVLHKGPDNCPEVSVWRCTPGTWPLELKHDELCYFAAGKATYTSDQGEVIEVGPETLVHFKSGWKGRCRVEETIFVTFMLCEGGPAPSTPVLRQVLTLPAAADWGLVPTNLEGDSRTSGVLLSKEPDGRAESGIWICTPGTWFCHVTRDEFCHFLLGRCTYTHESGEVIEIEPDTAAFFPKDWKGTCCVHQEVRKVYMIR